MRLTGLVCFALGLLTLMACAEHPMDHTYQGTCKTAEATIDFTLHNLKTDRVGTVVPDVDHEAMQMNVNVVWDKAHGGGGGDLIVCNEPDGCTLGETPDLTDLPQDWYRYDMGFFLDDDPDNINYRLVLEGVRESKKTLEGTCFQASFGTFTAKRKSVFYDPASEG